MILGLGLPDIKPIPKTSSAFAAVAIVGILVSGAAVYFYWRHRRAKQMSNMIRLEPEPSGTRAPSDEALNAVNLTSNAHNQNALVEPFLARKLTFLSTREWFRRIQRSRHRDREPLIAVPPPSYQSVIQQQL